MLDNMPWLHCADARNAMLAQDLLFGMTVKRTQFSPNEIPDGQEFKREIVEVLGGSSAITDCRNVMLTHPLVKMHPVWLANEIAHYVDLDDPQPPILAWLPEAKVRRFHALDKSNCVEGHYGYNGDIFTQICATLESDPETKRCVVPFYTGLNRKALEQPCALTTQYLIRSTPAPELWTVNTYRSHDFFAGVRMDPIRISVVQQAVAATLGIRPGPLIMQEGSLHYYTNRPHMPLGAVAAWTEGTPSATGADHREACRLDVFQPSLPGQNDNAWLDLEEFVEAFRRGPQAGGYLESLSNPVLDGILASAGRWWEHQQTTTEGSVA